MVATGLGWPTIRGRTPGYAEMRKPAAPERSVRAGIVVFTLYLAASVFGFWHTWAHPATWQPAYGTGDVARYDWFLAWVPWALGHGANPFVTHVANWPFGVNVMDDTSVMALGFVMAPVTVLFGPAASLNVLLTLAFPLSAGAAYLLARRFVTWRPAAFAAGLLYGFSPYMVGQGSTHLNLSFIPLPPLIFLALYELLIRQEGSSRRWGALLGVMVAVQFMISTEITATTALFAAIALALVAVFDHRRVLVNLRRAAGGLAVALGVAVVLLAVPFYEALFGPYRITGRVPGFEYYYSALVGPLLPTSNMLFGTAHLKTLGNRIGGNLSENGTYLGIPLVLLLGAAVFVVRRRVVRIGVALAFIAFVLSLGISFHFGLLRYARTGSSVKLPGDLIFHIPKLNAAYPVRYSLFVVLFASVVLAVVMDSIRSGRYTDAPATAGGARDGRGSLADRGDGSWAAAGTSRLNGGPVSARPGGAVAAEAGGAVAAGAGPGRTEASHPGAGAGGPRPAKADPLGGDSPGADSSGAGLDTGEPDGDGPDGVAGPAGPEAPAAGSQDPVGGRPAVGCRPALTGGQRTLLAAAVGVVALLPLVPAWPYPAQGPVGVPRYFTTSAVDAIRPGSVALVYPVPVNTNASAMLWQAEASMRFKMVGGYFVVPGPNGSQYFTPSRTQAVLTALSNGQDPGRDPALRAALRAQLRSWHVESVVAQPVGADPIGFLTWLVGRPPNSSQGGTAAWYHVDWAPAPVQGAKGPAAQG